MGEIEDIVAEHRRKARSLLVADGAINDSIMANVADAMDDAYDPVTPLPRMTIRESAYYDKGVLTSIDVEITTARHFDPDMIRTIRAALQPEALTADEVKP